MVSVDLEQLTVAIYLTVLSGVLAGIIIKSNSSLRAEIVELKMAFKSDFGELWAEMGELRAEMGELRAEMGELRAEMATKSDLAEIRSEMAIMRSDLTHVALALGARPRATEDG